MCLVLAIAALGGMPGVSGGRLSGGGCIPLLRWPFPLHLPRGISPGHLAKTGMPHYALE